jgi:hypothetical protein
LNPGKFSGKIKQIMITKEEALEDFLKNFRISLNFILLYSKDHKSFLESVAHLQEKTAALSVYLNPIEINFAAEALSIEGVVYSKITLHRELAALFHQRKIQSLRLERGITEEELVLLLEKLSLSPKEIIKAGGLAEIFSGIREKTHFRIIDLDYSQLLRGEGEEVKDIWLFMLHNALASGDSKKIEELADNFERMIKNFKIRDLIENEELHSDLRFFLEHLKKTSPEKAIRVSREIMRVIIRDKTALIDDEKVRKLKTFLTELSVQDYSQILWDEIVSDANFDVSSFKFFSKFLSNEEHGKVADFLFGNLSRQRPQNMSANVARKVKELFSFSSEASAVSEIYRRAVSALGETVILDPGLVYNRKQMLDNYRYILLNLLLEEKNSRQLETIVGKLSKEWDKIVEERDQEYLKCLGEVIQQKKASGLDIPLFLELRGKLGNFVESFIWEENVPLEFSSLIETMEESFFGAEVYLGNIFEKAKINSRILKAFFRFFPNKLPDFYARLKDKRSDIDFVVRVVESLKEIDSALILSVLELIYSFSNDVIKGEILRMMARAGKYNREFVFDALKGGSQFIRKEALEVFSQQQDYQKAMEIFFMLPNPWGKNNAILAKNLEIVEELKYKPAVQYLEQFYRSTAFWNFRLKKRIKQVLGRLNV